MGNGHYTELKKIVYDGETYLLAEKREEKSTESKNSTKKNPRPRSIAQNREFRFMSIKIYQNFDQKIQEPYKNDPIEIKTTSTRKFSVMKLPKGIIGKIFGHRVSLFVANKLQGFFHGFPPLTDEEQRTKIYLAYMIPLLPIIATVLANSWSFIAGLIVMGILSIPLTVVYALFRNDAIMEILKNKKNKEYTLPDYLTYNDLQNVKDSTIAGFWELSKEYESNKKKHDELHTDFYKMSQDSVMYDEVKHVVEQLAEDRETSYDKVMKQLKQFDDDLYVADAKHKNTTSSIAEERALKKIWEMREEDKRNGK